MEAEADVALSPGPLARGGAPASMRTVLFEQAPGVVVRTPATKVPLPTHVTVEWSDGSRHAGAPTLLASGRARDCLVLGQRGYVLKVQEVSWEDCSNGVEVELSSGAFAACVPAVYGCVHVRYDDRDLSVLAMERGPATFHGVVNELLQGPLTAPAHRTLVGLVSAFFALVARAARDLRYSVRDLHWDNLGVTSTAPAPAVVFIDFERCSYAAGLSEQKRHVAATVCGAG